MLWRKTFWFSGLVLLTWTYIGKSILLYLCSFKNSFSEGTFASSIKSRAYNSISTLLSKICCLKFTSNMETNINSIWYYFHSSKYSFRLAHWGQTQLWSSFLCFRSVELGFFPQGQVRSTSCLLALEEGEPGEQERKPIHVSIFQPLTLLHILISN